ncbi:MAG: M50 family metallopeptidase [Anaerolineaceae bacterium]|jgi:regulator of sigma E protease|nr:M50 family metallopeptidase [Anaerolineaceae bacterium]MDD4043127.1 M50 family metallopeptidase [Anaerolineaceae bacterium]MDD4578109.1 M50 family metallopeptidase [Anaerolineaceae bacterium]
MDIWTILQFIFFFGFLIFIHELGHMLVAKSLGIAVEEFGFGYPPRLAKLFTWKGTEFTLNWIPFGGFVRLKGENESVDEPGGLLDAPKWKRFLVLVAGATMNFIFGIILLIVMFSVAGGQDTTRVMVAEVAPNSPAQVAGMQAGDVITRVGDYDIASFDDISAATKQYLDVPVELSYVRDSTSHTIELTPRSDPPEGQGAMGVSITYPVISLPFGQSVAQAFKTFWLQVETTVMIPVNLIRGAISSEDARLVGIKGIYDIFNNAAQMDQTSPVAGAGGLPIYRLSIISMISIAVGITNLLPIPALDGGQILFLIIEAISRKRIPENVAATINSLFFYALILLMIFITIQDFRNPILGP